MLVPGSDMDEPVADALRGLLDGHIVLDREIAEGGRFPAIDVGRSVSRSAPACYPDWGRAVVAEARARIAAYRKVELLLQAGLYVEGRDAAADRGVRFHEPFEAFLATPSEGGEDALRRLSALLEETG